MPKRSALLNGFVFVIASTSFSVAMGACPPGGACLQNLQLQPCLTGPDGDCSSTQTSPVIVYKTDWMNGSNFGGSISFQFTSKDALPSQTYGITIGTLDPNNAITINTSSANPTLQVDGQDYFGLVTTPANGTPIPYTVSYLACNNTSKMITPPTTSTSAPSTFAVSAVEMAGTSPACTPLSSPTPGTGAGALIFNLINPGSSTFSAGTYMDTLTVTVCSANEAACL